MALTVLFLVLAIRSARPSAESVRISEMSYLDLARPLVLQSNQLASIVGEVRLTPAQLGLVELHRQLGQLVSQSAQVNGSVSALAPPSTLSTASRHLRACLRDRAMASAALRDGMNEALSAGPSDVAVATLSTAGQEMGAADREYSEFLRGIPGEVRKQAAMPRSVWVAVPGVWGTGRLSDFVGSVRGSSSLQVDHNLLLSLVSLDPSAVQRNGVVNVLPPTGSLTVSAVIVDTGNQPERGVPVVATLQPASGSSSTVHVTIDISPGQHLAVTFPPLATAAGTTYVLSLSAGPVPGETSVDDNHVALTVQIHS